MKLIFIDEINCKLDTEDQDLIEFLRDRTGVMVSGAHVTPAFKSGNWDGKESLLDHYGHFFQTMLDEIFEAMEEYGIDLDSLEVHDMREPLKHDRNVTMGKTVREDHFIDHGWTLREHQMQTINTVLLNEKGIIEVGTAGGKSGSMAGICKVYDDDYRSITVTDGETLVNQLYATYSSFGLDCGRLNKAKVKDRYEFLKNTKHIITTHGVLMNCAEFFEAIPFQGVFINDEVHMFGDKFSEFVKLHLADCPIRVGFTGTLTTNKINAFKRKKIIAHIGGGPLIDVGVKKLKDQGYVADFDVKMIKIDDQMGKHKAAEAGTRFDWAMESSHLGKNEDRAALIGRFIMNHVPNKNRLILARSEIGRRIAEYLDCPFIDKDVKVKDREEFFTCYDTMDDFTMVATYDTVGTGTDIERIFNEVLVDVGKNPRYIGQGIGRGIRKDGVIDYLNVFDIYSDTKFSLKQEKERIKYYKQKGYPFKKVDYKLELK